MARAAQLALALEHRPALGREDFLVAPSNADAVGWIDRWPDWPAPCLVLHGPPGSGKTHLVEVWRGRTGAGVVAGRDVGDEEAALMLAAAADNLAIDGAEAEPPDRALLHLYNAIAEKRGTLLLTAERAPAQWPRDLPDLLSRLRAAPSAAVAAPDDSLLAAVIVKQFADRRIEPERGVVEYLVTHIERSFAAARDAVATIDREALARRRRITLTLVREVVGAAAE